MTGAVGNAAPSGAETLLQSAAGKVPGGHRSRLKDSEESESQPEEMSEISPRDEVHASNSNVDKTEKTSKRKSGKTTSDNEDSSFEDTFDSIGQDNAKDDGLRSTGMATYPPDLVVAKTIVSSASVGKSDVTSPLTEASQVPLRAAPLLQQRSILALIDAKDRLFANAGELKSQSGAQSSDSTADRAEVHANDATEAIPITIDRRETHWNFTSDEVAGSTPQISALQANDGNISQPVLIQSAASAAVMKELTAETKTQDTKTSINASQNAISQPVAAPDADKPANSSFSDGGSGNNGSAQPQNQTVSGPSTERKAEKTGTASPLDQIFSTNESSQQNPPTLTSQVRDGVLNSLASSNVDASANTSAATANLPTRSTAAPVLRTLDLTLSPADLGSVKLRLSLKSNSLSIEAEASKASTAKLLNDDRPNLERGLKDAGYDISSLKIADTSASNLSNSSGWQTNGSPSRDSDQARSGFAGGQDGAMQRGNGSSSDQAQRRPKDGNPQTASADVANSRAGNAVYI